MSYIGQGLPADTFQGFVTDSFTGDGSATTFTLSKEPFSEDTLIVVINNVIQKPTTNFTVSGTTLTIVGTAVADGDVIYAIHMGGPLPIGGAAELDLNGASDKLILDADGDTTISADTDDQIDFKAGGTDIFQLTATTATFNDNVSINIDDNTDGLTITSTDADATNGPGLRLFRNSASPADGDDIGRIIFSGENDASEQINYAIIRGDLLDVTDGTEDGIIKYETIFAGTNREMMRMGNGEGVIINEDGIDMDFRIESDGLTHAMFVDGGNNLVHLGTSSSFGTFLNISGGSTHDIGIENSTGNKSQIIAKNNSSSHNTQMLILQSIRTSTNAFEYFRFIANDGGDVDMLADGNGDFKIDGSVTTGGIDYAEFFEWKDGNSSDEDRRGHSVILDGNKIIVATSSDDTSKIIGIVSTNPTVVGGGDMEKWVHKYLRDDYDSPIWEEHTVTEWTDEDGKKHSYQTDKIPADLTVPSDATVISEEEDKYGNTVKLKRKKLNPEWDSSQQYISRQDRKEWEAIGLMGKLRLKKGEPVNTNWIKLRDISTTVEEWLVK